MEELIKQLLNDTENVIKKIELQSTKTLENLESYRKEYDSNDRTIRESQVGKIQKDKTVGEGEKFKLVRAVRIPINMAKKIVNTSTAFEVGKPVTLVASEQNTLSDLIKQIWKVNRIDSSIQKLVTLKKKETQVAIQFYIKDLKPNSILSKILIKAGIQKQAKEIKTLLLENKNGSMFPYFDSVGNMLLFMWKFKSLNADGKSINNVQIWDEKNFYHFTDETGKMFIKDKPIVHGFDRIPIVYVSQDQPEWFDVKEMIDRLEVSISKLGSSNDYTAYPLLKIFGEVQSFPDKDESGKVLQFPMQIDENGKEHHGDSEFMESKGAGESQKLELDKLESFIHSISQTPNLSFENLKSLGNVSGVALKLMFLDAIIKASLNEGENRTMIERIINIILSGIVNTTNTSLSKEGSMLYYDIIFNSILPDDLKESVEIVTAAVEAKIMSRKTAIEYLSMNEDTDEEIALIDEENKITEPTPVV